jgi:ABC-type multidrug transport system permease subunit
MQQMLLKIITSEEGIVSYQALTQPSSIGRVLDSGFKLFAASFKPVLMLVIFTALINVILQYAMYQIMLPAQGFASEEEMAQYMISAAPQLIAVSVMIWLVSIILYNAILSRVGEVARGGDGVMYDALIVGIRKTLPVFIAAILYTLAISIGFMLLVIPGLILMITLLFFQVLIVVENEGIIASLKQSHRLVWGNYWRTTAVILVPFFIMYALIMVVAFAAGFLGAVTSPEMMEGPAYTTFGLFDVLMASVSVLMVPLMDAIFVAHVNDLKLRTSGSDLELRMALNA